MRKNESILPPKSSDGKNGEQLALEQGFKLHPYSDRAAHYEGKTWYRNIPRRIFEKKKMIMKGLPRGYALAGKPDSSGRVNRYIFGHPTKKTYRSSTEFAPHIIWLYQDQNKRKDCECHLCIYASKMKIPVEPIREKENNKQILREKQKKIKNSNSENEQRRSLLTKYKVNNKIRAVSCVYIESPPNRHDLPIPDNIAIPDLILPTHHCLS